jgi:predicted transcriptional regulator
MIVLNQGRASQALAGRRASLYERSAVAAAPTASRRSAKTRAPSAKHHGTMRGHLSQIAHDHLVFAARVGGKSRQDKRF